MKLNLTQLESIRVDSMIDCLQNDNERDGWKLPNNLLKVSHE